MFLRVFYFESSEDVTLNKCRWCVFRRLAQKRKHQRHRTVFDPAKKEKTELREPGPSCMAVTVSAVRAAFFILFICPDGHMLS